MNKYEHSEQSAKIFGGKPEEYEVFHALIDSNKTVTPSIFGRFFLHHIDVGQPILEKVFGKTLGVNKIPVRKLLIQHLLEDYDKVLTFHSHWLPALKENQSQLPKLDQWDSVLARAKLDPRLKKLTKGQLGEMEDFFRLKMINETGTGISLMRNNDLIFAIFGHALGGDLIAKIIGKKFHGHWTSDVVTGFLNCRFKWSDRSRDPVPTLLDYERCVPDQPWMHAPKNYGDESRLNVNRMKKMIKDYESHFTIKKTRKHSEFDDSKYFSGRKNCNLD